MADFETIDIPLAGGIDTKSDEKLAPEVKLAVLENAVFNKRGSVVKRAGYTTLGTTDQSGDTVTLSGIMTRGNEPVGVSSDKLYTYADGELDRTGSWVERRTVPLCKTDVFRDISAEDDVKSLSYAELDGVGLYAWYDDNTGNTKYAVINTESRATIRTGTLSTASDKFAGPAVVALPDALACVWAEDIAGNWTLRVKGVNPSAPYDVYTTASVTTSAFFSAVDPIFRVRAWKEFVAVLFCPVGANDLQMAIFDENGSTAKVGLYGADTQYIFNATAGADATAFNAGYADDADFDINDGGEVLIFKRDATTAWAAYGNVSAYSGGPPSEMALTTLDEITVAGTPVDDAIACALSETLDSNSDRNYYCFVSTTVSSYNRTLAYTINATSGTVTDTIHSSLVTSKAIGHGVGCLVTLLAPDYAQPTYQLHYFRSGETPVSTAALFHSVAGSETEHNNLYKSGSSVFFTGLEAVSVRSDGVDTDGNARTILTDHQPRVVEFTFGKQPSSALFGDSLYIASGNLIQYDGHRFVETGFHWYPDPTAMSVTQAAGGITAANNDTWSYRIYYERQNAQGLIERSTAIPVTFTAKTSPSGNYQFEAGNKKRTITIPTLTTTMDSNVRIAVYRTEKNPTAGALYYRVSSYDTGSTGDNAYLANSKTASTVTFSDNMTDASLILQEVDIVGASGELENIQPQAPNFVSAERNRLVVGGGGVGRFSVQRSKLSTQGYAVAFSDVLSEEVDRSSGPVTGLASLGDSTIVFKRSHIWAIDGEGPDNLGIGGWALPRLVSSDVGCTSEPSIVVTPVGVMFKSSKGIYATNAQQATYAGADVEAFNGNDVVSASHFPDTNYVVFCSSTGSALVYDYFFNQWSTFTNHKAVGAATTSSRFLYMKPDGTVYISDSDSWLDAGVPYSLRIVTNWMKLGKLQDFMRVRRFSLLGTYHHAHKLSVRVYSNYEDTPTDSFSFLPKTDDSGTLMNNRYWGDLTWGAGSWGATDTPGLGVTYQFSNRVSEQKAQSMRVEIFDSNRDSLESDDMTLTGKGYELQAISLEVRKKPGLMRLHDGRKV